MDSEPQQVHLDMSDFTIASSKELCATARAAIASARATVARSHELIGRSRVRVDHAIAAAESLGALP